MTTDDAIFCLLHKQYGRLEAIKEYKENVRKERLLIVASPLPSPKGEGVLNHKTTKPLNHQF